MNGGFICNCEVVFASAVLSALQALLPTPHGHLWESTSSKGVSGPMGSASTLTLWEKKKKKKNGVRLARPRKADGTLPGKKWE